MMNIPNNNRRNRRIPLWQSEKMRNIIESHWEEVWKVAVDRNHTQKSLHRYLESPQRNSSF
ncbi:MAG: hypothetical protein ACFCU5_14840 [Pleurocapsa sp.]